MTFFNILILQKAISLLTITTENGLFAIKNVAFFFIWCPNAVSKINGAVHPKRNNRRIESELWHVEFVVWSIIQVSFKFME